MADSRNGRVQQYDIASGDVSTLVEGLDWPDAIAVSPGGTVVVAEQGASRLVAVDEESFRPIAGTGESEEAAGVSAPPMEMPRKAWRSALWGTTSGSPTRKDRGSTCGTAPQRRSTETAVQRALSSPTTSIRSPTSWWSTASSRKTSPLLLAFRHAVPKDPSSLAVRDAFSLDSGLPIQWLMRNRSLPVRRDWTSTRSRRRKRTNNRVRKEVPGVRTAVGPRELGGDDDPSPRIDHLTECRPGSPSWV